MLNAVLAAAFSVALHWTPSPYSQPVTYLIEATKSDGTVAYTTAAPIVQTDGTLKQTVLASGTTTYRVIAYASEWPGTCKQTSAPSNCSTVQAPANCPTCPGCASCCPTCPTLPTCPAKPVAPPYEEPAKGTFGVRTGSGINESTLEATSLTNSTVVNVNFPAAGTWYLWGRLYYPGEPGSNDANSLWVKLDAGSDLKFGNSKDHFKVWHWGGDGAKETGTPVPLKLVVATAGVHKLTFRVREFTSTSRVRFDAIYLSQSTTPPTDSAAKAALIAPTISCW